VSIDEAPFFKGAPDGVVLAKLRPDGTPDWAKAVGGSNVETDYQMSVALDGEGNILLAGDFVDSVDFGAGVSATINGSGMFVAKLTPEGAPLWVRSFGCQFAGGMALDTSGAATFSCGNSFEPITIGDETIPGVVLLAKLGGQGDLLWKHGFDGGISAEGDALRGLPDGRVVMSFMLIGSVDFGLGPVHSSDGQDFDAVIPMFDGNGVPLWNRVIAGSGTQRVEAIDIDSDGNTYLGGATFGPTDLGGGAIGTKSWTSFAGKLDPNGNHLWSKTIGGDVVEAYRFGARPDGGVMISGLLGSPFDAGCGPISGGDASSSYVARLDSNGVCLSQTLLGSGTSFVTSFASNAGKMAYAGYFQETFDVGNGPVKADSNDAFVVDIPIGCP
jgi:hypothetical protein